MNTPTLRDIAPLPAPFEIAARAICRAQAPYKDSDHRQDKYVDEHWRETLPIVADAHEQWAARQHQATAIVNAVNGRDEG